MLNRVDEALSNMARPWLVALILVAIVALGAMDYLTGYKLSFAIFYLIPIALATWYVDKGGGLAAAFLSVFISTASGLINAGNDPEIDTIVLWNGLTPMALFVVIVTLLDKLHARLQLEQRLARTDHLTGCLNAHAFLPLLQYHFDLARRDQQPMTLAYIDLDDFKMVNDRHGHGEGDRTLKIFARIWLESCRRTDLMARLGGDEFCILFPNTDQHGAASIINKARRALAAACQLEHTAITCSIGAMTFPTVLPDSKEAIQAADMLMYQVKKQGKNSTIFAIFDEIQAAQGNTAMPDQMPLQPPQGREL